MRSEPLDVRFFAKVRMTSGCWWWEGGKNQKGYGQVWADGRSRRAHRVAYERLVGPIPVGLQLDHLCRNRACVRPDHLEPVSNRENVLRGDTIVAVCAAKTHCDNGHALTGDNIRIKVRRDGVERVCIQCDRASSRRRYQRRKELAASPETAGAGYTMPPSFPVVSRPAVKEPSLPEGQR